MEDINICDCCKDIWNRENLIKFDFTNNHKLFICPDCLKEMTNGDMIKAIFPNAEFDNAMPFTDGRWETMNLDTENKTRAMYEPTQLRTYADWWNAPYERS